MNAKILMKMFNIPEQDVTVEEAKKIYADKVAQYDAQDLDHLENEVHRQAGTICYTPEEFFNTEHVSGYLLRRVPSWSSPLLCRLLG